MVSDEKPMYPSDFDLTIDAESYAGGAYGVGTLVLREAAQIIDAIITCKPATFVLDHFFVGDQEMLNGFNIPADIFFATVVNRGVRFTTLRGGRQAKVEFRNKTTDPTPEKIKIKVQVRSYHKREELLPESVE